MSNSVRGKAEICNYRTRCQCNNEVNFTDSIIRDVLIAGIEDTDIRREILGMVDILDTPINNIIALVESKEMARNALPPSTVTEAASSLYGRHKGKSQEHPGKLDTLPSRPIPCPDCGNPFSQHTEGKNGLNTKPHK